MLLALLMVEMVTSSVSSARAPVRGITHSTRTIATDLLLASSLGEPTALPLASRTLASERAMASSLPESPVPDRPTTSP